MKVHIYVLFLSIWTINCLAKNKNNVSSSSTTTSTTTTTTTTSTTSTTSTTTTTTPIPTVDKITESTGSGMDDFRKRLLGFIVGIMIIAFTFTCFCLLHYNCMIEEVQSPGGFAACPGTHSIDKDGHKLTEIRLPLPPKSWDKRLNKENMAAISSWVSKVSACQPDMITEDVLETQPLLLNSNQTAGPLCQEKQSIPNSVVKSIQPSSLEKPCIPPNAPKAMRCSNTDKSSTPGSVKKLGRQLGSKMSTKSSSPQRLHKSSHLDKSHKKRSLKKSYNLTNACKLASQANSSSSERQIIPPWLAILQTSSMLTTQSCSSASHSQIMNIKPSRTKEQNQSCGCHDLKEPVSRGKGMLQKHSPAKTCRHYNEKCLICNTPEFLLNDLSETIEEHAENPHVSMNMKSSSKSFYETDYLYSETEYNSYQDNESNDTMKTYDSEDSDAEIVIICDTSNNEDDVIRSISQY